MGPDARQRFIAAFLALSILGAVAHVCHHEPVFAADVESGTPAGCCAQDDPASPNTGAVDHPDHEREDCCPCICHVPVVVAPAYRLHSIAQIFPCEIDSFGPPAAPDRTPIDPPPWRS